MSREAEEEQSTLRFQAQFDSAKTAKKLERGETSKGRGLFQQPARLLGNRQRSTTIGSCTKGKAWDPSFMTKRASWRGPRTTFNPLGWRPLAKAESLFANERNAAGIKRWTEACRQWSFTPLSRTGDELTDGQNLGGRSSSSRRPDQNPKGRSCPL